MRFPNVHGIIRRRLLVNFRVDREVLQARLPAPFAPKLQGGFGIAGICLIRLEEIRPRRFPKLAGLSSENAAHRIAVTWEGKEGVYIPRRDTGSLLNALAGGRLFPGEHHRASFEVQDDGEAISLRMQSLDRAVRVEVAGRTASALPPTSCFSSIEEVSRFFEGGSLGYSVTTAGRKLDGVILETRTWKVEPLAIDRVYSSWFAAFPKGSVEFDCALVMRNIEHEWHAAEEMYVLSS
ncbi:MAG TPA: DUF2071 domain-containing protein [Thermoanaerobaculia bacterium]|jgi:hypothetical protein|nr:DUF2071 domain-containing protein [Thermoanaerobaculia bacterium]